LPDEISQPVEIFRGQCLGWLRFGERTLAPMN
jgi:hypothetical protein